MIANQLFIKLYKINNIFQQETRIMKKRMANSRSHSNIKPNLERNQSYKMFYVNDQFHHSKDVATIFHSPFKDGKKNNNYINPSFLSSNLFYGDEQPKKELTPRQNLVLNKHQKMKKQLYEKRMEREDSSTNIIHQANNANRKKKEQNRKANDQSQISLSKSRSRIQGDKNSQLIRELETLIKYRELDQKKNRTSRINTQYKPNATSQTPIYIQKNRLENEEKANNENKKNLQQWVAISERLKQMKSSIKRQSRKVQTQAMDNYIANNNQKRYQQVVQNRKNANLLANILKEQIKQAEAKKQIQRKQRFNFN